MEENDNKIIKLLKYARKFGFIIIIISFVLFIYKVNANHIETIEMTDAVPRWYEQLPQYHWIKQDDDFNDLFYDLMHIEHEFRTYEKGLLNLSLIGMEQSKDYAERFLAKVIQKREEEDKRKYHLYYTESNKKIVNVIRVEIGENMELAFYYDEEAMLFDFTKEQYVDEIQCNTENGKLDLTNRLVFSYVDNPEIATIFNGKIVGLQKGKTKLHICCNGYDFQYTIKVN
ncbi:hypothetical protein D7V90_22285 [bacterium 1xD42-87]|nr:hypothetical protein D7V90_22285 [bacterium 1xD42-87]